MASVGRKIQSLIFMSFMNPFFLIGDDMRRQSCNRVSQNVGYYLRFEVGKGYWPELVNSVGLLELVMNNIVLEF